jgi:hypothetical protein
MPHRKADKVKGQLRRGTQGGGSVASSGFRPQAVLTMLRRKNGWGKQFFFLGVSLKR